MSVILFTGNRSPSITDTIKVNGIVFDLTGSTVRFRMRIPGTAAYKVDSPAVIVGAATNGNVRYDWAAADVDTAGEYVAWWSVTLPSGLLQDTPEFDVVVSDHSLTHGYLCTLNDVREYLQKTNTDVGQDEVVLALIARASSLIGRYAQREFSPTASATRRSKVLGNGSVGWLVDLAPWDLRTAATMTLHPEGTAVVLTTGNGDYQLEPVNTPDGTYQQVKLSKSLTMGSPTRVKLGNALLDIAGAWGFATIPPEVQHACIVTVGLWMRREVQVFSATFNLDEARVERPEALPSAVRAMLDPFKRMVP